MSKNGQIKINDLILDFLFLIVYNVKCGGKKHMTKLLHIEKNIPEKVLKVVKNLQEKLNPDNLVLSRHIQEHLEKGDRKHSYNREGLFNVLKSLKKNPIIPFEVEVDVKDNGFWVNKYVVRLQYDTTYDISISIRGKMVITAWLNRFDDTHFTLDLSKYDNDL